MYIIPVEVKESDIEGKGVFATADIKKGSIVWKFIDGHDIRITPEEYEKSDNKTKKMIRKVGYLSPNTNLYVFPPANDPACFTNHSKDHNLSTIFDSKISNEPYFVANRDIQKDEELTNNYLEFDKVAQTMKPDWA